MHRPAPGRYVPVTTAGEPFLAFVPTPLPPEPPVEWSAALRKRFDAALVAIGRLDAITALLPNASLLLYSFVRKEAVLSSQIEGTQSSLADLLLYEIDEAPGVPVDDAREVSRCVAALERGHELLRDGLPLCMRLLGEMHEVLMRHPGGRSKTPGETRRTQVWIGGTRPGNAAFVPPPADALPDCLAALERFLNDEPEPVPALLKAALVHVQFETIHPYLDGNGRIGRLLVTLLLDHWKLLTKPLLYLSLFFKRHREDYYRRLNAVRVDGDWEGWLDFFLDGVATIADEAVASARELFALVAKDRVRVLASEGMSIGALRLFELLPRHPIVTVASAMKMLDTTKPTAGRAVELLVGAGVLVEMTGKRRDRAYAYRAYLDRLKVGTELSLPSR